jgi:formamidopyrimidine-DNA glycosylase
MSTPEQEEINALKAELAQYATLSLVERAPWREVITAARNNLTELLRAQNASSTGVEGKHLLSSV